MSKVPSASTLKLCVVTIHHRLGVLVFLNRTLKGAREAIAQYCEDCWFELFDEDEEPLIEDKEERIKKYFDTYQSPMYVDRGVNEYYTIEEDVEVDE
jgi:hypothetical protein